MPIRCWTLYLLIYSFLIERYVKRHSCPYLYYSFPSFLFPWERICFLLLAPAPVRRSLRALVWALLVPAPSAGSGLGGRTHRGGASSAPRARAGARSRGRPAAPPRARRAAFAPAKMEMEEPTPRFFSDIFPENHADLSWVLDG